MSVLCIKLGHSTGRTGIRYVTADINEARVTFTVTSTGLQFEPDVSDININTLTRLYPSVPLKAARYSRRVFGGCAG